MLFKELAGFATSSLFSHGIALDKPFMSVSNHSRIHSHWNFNGTSMRNHLNGINLSFWSSYRYGNSRVKHLEYLGSIRHFSTKAELSGTGKSEKQKRISLRDPKYKTGWKCLLRCIYLERFMVIPTMIALLISSAVISSFPMAVGNFVNKFSVSDNPPIPLYTCILAVLAAALSSFAKSTLSILVGDRIAMRLRRDTFAKLMKKGIPFYDSNTSGTLCSVLTSDVIVASNVVNHMCQIIRSGITFLAGTTLSLTLAPISLFAYTVLPVAASMFVIFPSARYIQRLSASKLKNISLMAEHANQRFSNMRTVKAFNAEALECHTFHKKLLEIMKVAKQIAIYSGITSFIAVGAVGTLILLMAHNSAYLVLSGSMKVGDVTSLLMYSALIGGSVQGFTSGLSEIQKCIGASQALQDIHKWEAKINGEQVKSYMDVAEKQTSVSDLERVKSAIKFDSITFSYPTRPNVKVLDDVSFSIEHGKKLVVMGSTGCGKSTLFQLLLGFYEPNSGSISINGKNLADIGDKNLRQEISWVEQLGVLFGDTIRSNATYSIDSTRIMEKSKQIEEEDSVTSLNIDEDLENYKVDNLENIYKVADLEKFLDGLPEGDETLVGQNGYSLSGGQRQRILIARALVKDSPIILLDEPTSALDIKSENIIKTNLQTVLKDKTAIIVTHRTSLLSLADYIMCMDGGKICQFGPRDQVLGNPCDALSKIVPRQYS
ncbi:ABC transporter, ATP-binding protein family member protein [Theileria equi strain WA]|uniref:ABC transporter, ATP-binding protein family member protein n=1 Tax=Theileria equi strain WA TaxID=1537102 RepID=L1LDY2_THEEQ|nr:ABC transporter, ATP-binding protein family member protein [Theileria equi strain WA]EKX73489.1 ABC transporter, ATP-binding protein family member protein [Theileria equi strain WA]|eukprot:XP_004832941.1 ABC transporter, ATP-binding protein family member protein [Theileria equi strain WA]